MDRQEAKLVSEAIEKALGPVAETFGLILSVRGGRYDSTGFSPRIEFKTKDAGKILFGGACGLYGLKPEDYGRKFLTASGEYELVELRPSSPTWPIVGRHVRTGKMMKFKEGVLKTLAGVAPAVKP